jgi:hypothetical protein
MKFIVLGLFLILNISAFSQVCVNGYFYSKKGVLGLNKHYLLNMNKNAKLIIINTAAKSGYGVEINEQLVSVDTIINNEKVIFKSIDKHVYIIKKSKKIFVEIENQKRVKLKSIDSKNKLISELEQLASDDIKRRMENIKIDLDLQKKLSKTK